ncbi:MAG: nucleotidyltransferase domain-containing protein [Melioribacteraceae bacterium]|nr:nucleotidyltransferase domain-containing protein [Melioribacteraceae bacterium]
MKFGLSKKITDNFISVFKKHPEIENVIIYGSRAKGNYKEGSDIDITLNGVKITERIRSKVWLELDELNTPYLIDLSVFNSITDKDLIEHINLVGKVFYEKELSQA